MTSTKTIITAAAISGALVGAYLVIANRRAAKRVVPAKPLESISRDKLLEILRDLLTQFHGVFVEMAHMVQRLHKLGALRGPSGPMSSSEIADFLMQQGMQAKLDAAQDRVLAVHNVTQGQVEAAQDKHADDSEIAELTRGFTQMYEEAANGIAPILPGFTVPEHLTEDKALEILAEINEHRTKGFRIALREFWSSDEARRISASSENMQGPPPALAQALQGVHDQAEGFVMEKHITIINNKATFDSTVALYSRSSDGHFMKERLRMERAHQVEIVNLMRNRDSADAPVLEPIEGLSEKLLCSNEGDMAHQILEAAEKRIPVVTILVRDLSNAKTLLTPLSDAIENGTFSELIERNAVFLYMPAHDDIPIATRPEYKDVQVCYIFFPRPDKQQRPIACFSLGELYEASTIDKSIYEGQGAAVFDETRATGENLA